MFFIMGITQGRKSFDYNQMMVCEHCGSYGRYQVYMTYMCLSLFFIPCLKWDRQYYVQSTCCNTVYSLAPEIGKRIARGDNIEIRPEHLTRVQAGYKSRVKRCVIYFSQTGTTRAAAEKIAEVKKADLVEIRPERPYEMSYLKTVLTSLKEIFTKARPELAMEMPDIQKYDRILIGCPIWCGLAPNVILTLLDVLNLNGKHAAVFTTSGATKPMKLAVKLKKTYPEIKWHKPLNANDMTEDEIRNWM